MSHWFSRNCKRKTQAYIRRDANNGRWPVITSYFCVFTSQHFLYCLVNICLITLSNFLLRPTYYYNTEAIARTCSVKKDVLRNSLGNICAGVFFNKVASSLQLYCKKRLREKSFPVNLVKFLSASILKNWSNGRDWRKPSEVILACLLSGSSLKTCSEKHYLKAVKI